MRKQIAALLIAALVLALIGCGSALDGVEIVEVDSDIYSQKEIREAMEVAADYFKKDFGGCTLTEIRYAGDETAKACEEWAQSRNADEAILLLSSFEVGPSGGDGSLAPNSTYTDWQWVLVRDAGGKWRHIDHGYG